VGRAINKRRPLFRPALRRPAEWRILLAMKAFFAREALLPEGWAHDVRITADAAGGILSVEPGAAPAGAEPLLGAVIPGIPNLHSHAFQRAMAGAAERRGPAGQDSFWTWRETMYRFVGLLSPADAEAVAAQLYAELLQWGFTSVCEFHYLHHQLDGTPYAEPAEMALRHLAAARRAGIGMTLLPSLYRHGGIFGRDPAPGQRRFLNDLDGFARILERCRAATAGDPQAAVGLAPHSLRAVTPAMLAALADDAGLCPSTEASLGDGIFRLRPWLAAGGRLGIGTDSHVGVSPRDELRQLETSQRLSLGERAVASDAAQPHPGRLLLEAALAGGAQASGRPLGAIAPGRRCDLVALDAEHPTLVGHAGDGLLDAWVFSGQANPVHTVICGGRRVVEAGRHIAGPEIAADFAQAMRRLLA
jgi:formimidoylglutamate deiminase